VLLCWGFPDLPLRHRRSAWCDLLRQGGEFFLPCRILKSRSYNDATGISHTECASRSGLTELNVRKQLSIRPRIGYTLGGAVGLRPVGTTCTPPCESEIERFVPVSMILPPRIFVSN